MYALLLETACPANCYRLQLPAPETGIAPYTKFQRNQAMRGRGTDDSTVFLSPFFGDGERSGWMGISQQFSEVSGLNYRSNLSRTNVDYLHSQNCVRFKTFCSVSSSDTTFDYWQEPLRGLGDKVNIPIVAPSVRHLGFHRKWISTILPCTSTPTAKLQQHPTILSYLLFN